MSDKDFKIPKSLVTALKAGEVVPFVGAGVSMTVKKKNADGTKSSESLFPSWKGFVAILAQALRNENKSDEAAYVLSSINIAKPKYLDALQHAQEQLGKGEWYRLFDESFNKSKNEADEKSLKLNELIWELNNNLIITTNVDRVFQWTCPQPSEFRLLDVQNVEYAQLQKEQISKRPTVWYLHGHIDHKEKVIFTREQFEAFYKQKDNEAKLQTLLNFLTQRTFLFIGFSLDDDYLRELLEYIHNLYKGGADSFYILFREQDIATANFPDYVKPIPFSDFGKPLEDLIEELVHIANGNDNSGSLIPSPPPSSPVSNPALQITSLSTFSGTTSSTQKLFKFALGEKHFNVPFASKGDAFVGREGLREEIWKLLSKSGRAAISQIVNIKGIGGLGKTQLAVEYAYRFRDSYENGVFWLTADEDLDIQLIKIGGDLRWISESDTGFDQAALVRNRFRKLSDCLIIFDNVDNKDAIENYLPETNARPHVLITSREKQNLFEEINLDVLSRAESRRLLLETCNRTIEDEPEQKAFERILDELGDLPLAVELVGGFLAEHSGISFQKYLEFLEEVPLSDLEADFPSISFTHHDKSIIRTLKISERVLAKKPYLEDILDVLAWSGKSSMGYALLQKLTEIEKDYTLTVALSDLVNLRLIKEEKDSKRYTIHRLVARVRKFEKPIAGRKEWHQKIFSNLVEWFRARKDDFEFLIEFEAEIIHLQEWQSHSFDVLSVEDIYATAFRAYPLWHRGIYRESKILLDEALNLYQENSLNDYSLLANLYNDLGVIVSNLGNYQESLRLQQSALATISGEAEILNADRAKFLGNLGLNYSALGNNRKALDLQQQVLEIQRKLFGEKHPDVATSLSSLGSIYGDLGNNRKALELQQQALEIRRELFGEKHPDVATSLANLGSTYGELGNHQKALELKQQALEIRRELFGEKHPAIAISLGNLGNINFYLKEKSTAIDCHFRAMEMRREILGNQHPFTINSVYNLIYVLVETGYRERAGRLAGEFLSYVPQNHSKRSFFEQYGAMYKLTRKKKPRKNH